MHRIEFPDELVRRVTARTGRRHCCDSIDPRKTALLVVDMQNYFLQPGQQGECPIAREIVPNINRLAGKLRDSGGRVVWIRMLADEASRKTWSVFHERLKPDNRERRMNALSETGDGFPLWNELDIRAGDDIVAKTRYSPFTPGSSALEPLLRHYGVDTVLVTGVATTTCCDATARDAMALNFRTVMIADGCAAKTDDAHNATLWNFYNSFGDVQMTDEAIAYLARSKAAPLAAV